MVLEVQSHHVLNRPWTGTGIEETSIMEPREELADSRLREKLVLFIVAVISELEASQLETDVPDISKRGLVVQRNEPTQCLLDALWNNT